MHKSKTVKNNKNNQIYLLFIEKKNGIFIGFFLVGTICKRFNDIQTIVSHNFENHFSKKR